MFQLSQMQPYEGEIETLVFESDGKQNNPFWQGLGTYTDIRGRRWDVHGVIGVGEKPYIQARPIDDHVMYRTDYASCFQGYSAKWIPYYVELREPKE